MNCVKHPEAPASAYCRSCGKALCATCQHPALGTVFCEEHVPPATATAPAAAPPLRTDTPSPGLAFVLGLIPGVGAVYNGQYAKGLIHVVILGLLISILGEEAAGGLEPLFGMLTAAWVIYMPFEAYHTARKRQQGLAVDEFSSIFPIRSANTGAPVAPIVLIVAGVLFLLNNLGWLHMRQVLRFWPIALIAWGILMLRERWQQTRPGDSILGGGDSTPPSGLTPSEVANERY